MFLYFIYIYVLNKYISTFTFAFRFIFTFILYTLRITVTFNLKKLSKAKNLLNPCSNKKKNKIKIYLLDSMRSNSNNITFQSLFPYMKRERRIG